MAALNRSHGVFAVVLGAVATAATYWNAAVPRGILLDTLAIAALASAATGALRTSHAAWFRRIIWTASGALAFAAAASIAWMPPWILFLALGLAASVASRRPPTRWAPVRAFALILLGAVLNVHLLGSLAARTPFSADPVAYRALDLRAHSLMADVPLHDVWVIDLQGGGEGRSISDLAALPPGSPGPLENFLAGILVMSRLGVGRVFGWDTASAADPARSYITRLTAADRERCCGACEGERSGPFGIRTVYAFDREVMREVQNRTVHALLTMALVPADRGYRLYIGVYVRPTSWFTSFYMASIDAFRRLIVYPIGFRVMQHRWQSRWGGVSAPGR